jgi:4-diphosphocytidyl-2-C-methyl-D-erythritol kinase
MFVRPSGSRIIVHTPAKLNLSLEVLARRTDGYHEIETLIAAVGIYDTLVLDSTDAERIELACRWALGLAAQAQDASLGDLPTGEQNIVVRAVNLLRERAGISRGARILLIKRIPSAAGLGGASSDAAAALAAANLGWQLGWTYERLAELAAEIGSDVPVFLSGGTAICTGRGERIEPIRSARLAVVVARPPVGLSTPQVYRSCTPAVAPCDTRPLAAALGQGKVAEIGQNLHNRLEAPASRLTPWIGRLKGEFESQGFAGQQMSGSGSSYFGLARHARHARRVAARLRARRVGMVFAATTMR